MLCRSLFALLFFLFSSLYCLFFFDLRLLFAPLVSSNFLQRYRTFLYMSLDLVFTYYYLPLKCYAYQYEIAYQNKLLNNLTMNTMKIQMYKKCIYFIMVFKKNTIQLLLICKWSFSILFRFLFCLHSAPCFHKSHFFFSI